MTCDEDLNDSLIIQHDSYFVVENYDWIENDQIVEYWLPTTNHKQVMIHREMDSDAHVPQIGSWQSFELNGKKIERRVRKIVYNTKSRVYKVYIDYTHDYKKPVEYKKIENNITISFTETTDGSVLKYLQKWRDMISNQNTEQFQNPPLSNVSYETVLEEPIMITSNFSYDYPKEEN